MKPQSLNTTRSTHQRATRGQALLLAVLLMMFVSLLGVTFVTVVALNLEQTGRAEDKAQARQAARAGIEFAEARITNSSQGLDWQPSDEVTTIPTPNDANYYTPLEIAQGWGNAEPPFIKWPDPRTNENKTAPRFLLQVSTVTDVNSDKYGAIKITSIGLSPTNPNVFDRAIAYKGGYRQMPLVAAARSVTNWDFDNETVPRARVQTYNDSAKTLTISGLQGNFPAGNFYITIGDPSHYQSDSAPVRGAAVEYAEPYDAAAGVQVLHLATTVSSPNPIAGERVEVAAALGADNDFDDDNDSSTPRLPINFVFSLNSTPGNVLVNGGLLWYGNVLAQNLVSPRLADGTRSGAPIQASGLMREMTSASVVFDGAYDSGTSEVSLSNLTLVRDSSDTQFPTADAAADAALQLVSDGWNRLQNSTADTRQVQPFTPPDITAGGEGFGRYRQLTKYSAPAVTSYPAQASAYGYGRGIYINNAEDVEKITLDSAVSQLVPMSQQQLVDMWMSSDTGGAYKRKGTPAPADVVASLEEQHLRGWIAPDEFLPRGALLELNDTTPPTVTITLDPRADAAVAGDGNNQGPVPGKGWRDQNGNLLGDTTGVPRQGGVYSQTFPWPLNGVIFAEGNLRVKGRITSADYSLTVVSMNNIYIEDSVGIGDPANLNNRKLLLLARKNVVMNPTRVLGRIDVQTRLSAANAGDNTIQVYDAGAFHVGDFIKLDTGSSNDPVSYITDIDAVNGVLTLGGNVTAQAANTVVRTLTDPLDSSGNPYHGDYNRLDRFSQALQRRVNLPDGVTSARLALRHSAELNTSTEAFSVAYVAGDATPANVALGNKLVADTDPQTTIIQPAQKTLRIEYGPPTGSDSFPQTIASFDETTAEAFNLGTLRDEMNTNGHAPDWTYGASVLSGYGTPPSTKSVPPYYYLAAVGNRYNPGSATAPGFLPVPAPGGDYKIPMATSVEIMANAVATALQNDRWNGTLSDYEKVPGFGFNPYFGVSFTGTDAYKGYEDVLTVDQSFYTSSSTNDYTLDSRTVLGLQAGINTLALHFPAMAEQYFDDGGADIPYYRLSRLKLENSDLMAFDGTNLNFNKVAPGYEFDINAFVYAQEGSWFVIPGAYFDEDVEGTTGVNGSFDLNRDGTVTAEEQNAVYRFLRYNYKINFIGAIMEKQTATVTNTGDIRGAVAEWMDKWTTVELPASGTPVYTQISYTYDNSLARGFIDLNGNNTQDSGEALTDDAGLHLPVAPGLIYQSS